jgi:hypothetical protein
LAQRDLVETVLLLFLLTRFNYADSLSSRTPCYEKREQMIVVESGQLLNRIVQRAQCHFIRDFNRSLERFLKVCTPHTFDIKRINHICYRPPIGKTLRLPARSPALRCAMTAESAAEV